MNLITESRLSQENSDAPCFDFASQLLICCGSIFVGIPLSVWEMSNHGYERHFVGATTAPPVALSFASFDVAQPRELAWDDWPLPYTTPAR